MKDIKRAIRFLRNRTEEFSEMIDGYQAIDTPIEEFYYTAHIFNNFYTLEIEENNRVKLWTSNDEENHVITLIRD